MRITPFQYYHSMVQDLLEKEKNYDTLPNFTAADCLRLLGIGRNQYIDIMNQCRSSKKFLGIIKKQNKDMLPHKPVGINIEPWWIVNPGYITEDDVKSMVNPKEKEIIDRIVSDEGTPVPLKAGEVDKKDIKSLYLKGLVYLDVPIYDEDLIVVPPLEGFVMNRVTGDYFETLLYKIFVSIDEKTTVAELGNVLQIDLALVKNAISMYCRLGFAYKKGIDTNPSQYHPSWSRKDSEAKIAKNNGDNVKSVSKFVNSLNESDLNESIVIDSAETVQPNIDYLDMKQSDDESNAITSNSSKRIALLYDSTLAAFLMMGNLSPGLKNHAVTMFEVGKLPDESLDCLLLELSKISSITIDDDGGEAERYFLHAVILYRTIQFLRNNLELTRHLIDDSSEQSKGLGLDLIRCESLLNLDAEICQRLLQKNYKLIFSVAPLSNETRVITSESLPHLGASPLVNSLWFKLFIYFETCCGPPTLLLAKGARLTVLPKVFESYEAVMVTPWGRDSGIISVSNALIAINEAANYSALLIQAHPPENKQSNQELIHLPLPLLDSNDQGSIKDKVSSIPFENHPAIKSLASKVNLHRICGYITLINLSQNQDKQNDFDDFNTWTLFDCHFGIPLFDRLLNKQVCSRILANNLCQPNK